MCRSRARSVALAAAVATAATAPVAAAQEDIQPQGQPIDLPVLDIKLTVVSLDGSLSTTETEREVEVTLAADVLFAFDKASLAPAARGRIREAAARIRKDEPAKVAVEGHTDDKGSDAYNQRLSEQRADSVVSALGRELSGDAPPFQSGGRGESDPVAPNAKKDGSDNPRGRAKNRRVTITYGR
jgi:outer membrane protein OmpA-like peptidoglycan-associated protein